MPPVLLAGLWPVVRGIRHSRPLLTASRTKIGIALHISAARIAPPALLLQHLSGQSGKPGVRMMSFEYSDGGVDRPLWCIQSRGKIPQNRTRGRRLRRRRLCQAGSPGMLGSRSLGDTSTPGQYQKYPKASSAHAGPTSQGNSSGRRPGVMLCTLAKRTGASQSLYGKRVQDTVAGRTCGHQPCSAGPPGRAGS